MNRSESTFKFVGQKRDEDNIPVMSTIKIVSTSF